MNEKLPIIDQLHNAPDDRGRAGVLLACPDSVLLKHEPVFLAACRQFEAGDYFVRQRCQAMRAVRTPEGALPAALAQELEALRAELARFAAGPKPLDI